MFLFFFFFFFQAEDGIRDKLVTGVQTCALPISAPGLLSTVTGWPGAWLHLSASTRARVSGAPPGGKVTTIFTGLVGQTAWPCAAGTSRTGSRPSNGSHRLNVI